MKKLYPIVSLLLCAVLVLPVAAQDVQSLSLQVDTMKPAFILLCGILAMLAVLCVIFTVIHQVRKKHTGVSRNGLLLGLLYGTTVLVLAASLFAFFRFRQTENQLLDAYTQPPVTQPTEPPATEAPTTQPTEPPTTEAPTTQPTEPPTEPEPTYTPEKTESSDPANWNVKWEISTDGKTFVDSYQRPDPISFGKGEDYFALEGIATFRGNNYRNDAAFGTAKITNETLSKSWSHPLGSLNGWPGSGWTGQPSVVRWDAETRSHMTNMYPEKRDKDGLVEVVHATLDGYVYFYDLEDGSKTRDRIFLGMNFKGAGCLDPRGYPIFYVGSGIAYNGKVPRMYALSLLDGSILWEKGGRDSLALRGWHAYDSTPLVSAETDTLIWPAENGMLYTIKLNTSYDKSLGSLIMKPDEPVRMRYTTKGSQAGRYLGYECSAAAAGQYLYLSENGGMFFCIDLNTMEIVWAQDTMDDSNSSPVFRWENGKGYLYTAPSLHWTAVNQAGSVSVYKLDAQTGQIVWQTPFPCHRDAAADLSGGVQGSPVIGRPGTDMENLIIYPMAKTSGQYEGDLVALNTQTGEVVWSTHMNYCWSSPVGVYTDDGRCYIIQGDSNGKLMLLNGKTGELLNSIELGSNIEASPIVFENTIVVGTRGSGIYGITLN